MMCVLTVMYPDVLVLPFLLHLLESDVEQPHLPSWNNGFARYTQRSPAES